MSEETHGHNLGAIRDLLLAAFTAEEFARFCQDRPAFRPIVDSFGPKFGKDDMVAEAVNYCETRHLFSELLAEVKQSNPGQYARFEAKLYLPAQISLPKKPAPEQRHRLQSFLRDRKLLVVIAALALLAIILIVSGLVIWNQIENQQDPEYWMERFRQAHSPDLQVERLARLIGLKGTELRAQTLFFDKLTQDEQVAMFAVSDPVGLQRELFVVIKTLYTRLAYSPQNQKILGAMAGALSQIDDFESDTIRFFKLEVCHWQAGQDAYAQGDFKAAQDSFDNAVGLNDQNPATHHDRGLAFAAQGKDRNALSDLEQAVKLDETYLDQVLKIINGNPALFTYLGLHRSNYPSLMTYFPTLTPTPTPTFTPSPTPTPTSTPAPTATSTPRPTETPTPRNDLAYDNFDDNCINKSLWGMFEDGQSGTNFLPTPVGHCWELEQQGLSEQNGYLNFERTNTTSKRQGFLLAQQPGRTFTTVKLDLSVESFSGEWGGVGLFTRVSKLNDETEPWVHYWLRFGGNLPTNQGRVVYDEGETTKGEGTSVFSQSTRVTLELRWDGQTMAFYANGSPALKAVPFSGFSDTFGVYWVTGPNSSLKAKIDNFQVTWK